MPPKRHVDPDDQLLDQLLRDRTADEKKAAKKQPAGKKAAPVAPQSSAATAETTTVTTTNGHGAAAAGADAANGQPLSQAQRKELHRQRKLESEKAKEREAEKQVEQRLQQQRLQQMIRALVQQQQDGSRMFGGAGSPFGAEPNTEISSLAKSASGFQCGYAAMQGWRNAMEDAHVVLPEYGDQLGSFRPVASQGITANTATGLFAVFDGHSGDQAAKKCAAALPSLLATSIQSQPSTAGSAIEEYWQLAFRSAYKRLDDALESKLTDDSGCTAVSCLVTPTHVVCASVGDSRAVLCSSTGQAVALSDDHKPENEEERLRIEAAGGRVENNRVNGNLAMSRALGDFSYKRTPDKTHDKQLVTCVPDVLVKSRTDNFEFLVVACDGIFDVLSNQELIDYVRSELQARRAAAAENSNRAPNDQQSDVVKETCEAVCRKCLAPKTPNGRGPVRAAGTDNMTVIIVTF
jgi:protein phosphatase